MKKIFILLLFIAVAGCNEPEKKEVALANPDIGLYVTKEKKAKQEEIIEEYLRGCANKYPLHSQERQKCLDAGLKKDPAIAYLWQQKAMPLFKQVSMK